MSTVAKPVGDRLIVKRDEANDVTPGGIVLPDAAKDRPSRGKVVAVGSGRLLDNGSRSTMEVNEGDTVVFSTYGGIDVEIKGEDYVVLRETDVLFIV